MPTEPHNNDFSQLEDLFDQTLALPPEEREPFLRDKCADNPSLLARLLALLSAYEDEQQASETHRQSHSTDTAFQHRRLGPYELESLLGRGGMGAVYLAHRADGQYEKKVAIKVVDLPLATEVFYDRFRQERQILAGLDHPHIARLLDGGVSDDGILFLVMEYVEGTRIDEYCRSHQMPLDAKLRLFIAVCGAVQFAHQSLVIHRDLKPDNVLVSEDGAPHLLDFGTAKLMSSDGAADTRGLTREGFLSFTPAYASPEQVLGRAVTTSSDTYSLGVLLYQILTGHPPYELGSFTAEEMIRVICEQPIDPPSSSDHTFPDKDLEAILGKALRKEPEQRYQTAADFAADVQAYLDHQPVAARKGNLRYRALKFTRRNRLSLAFTAVLAVTLIVGVAAVLWQTHNARLAEQASEASARDLSQLSDTLLTELNDAIKRLPGSTGVQQLLVARVLEHLDRMSQTPHTNTFTQISLVNAYVRLANLQANPYEQNIDDVPGAIASLKKAMAIAEPLAASQPKDGTILLALARAQDARGEILAGAEKNVEAAQSLNAAAATYERVMATPAATPQVMFEAGGVLEILGDVMGEDTGFGDLDGAIRNYRRAIDYDEREIVLYPDFKPAHRGLATMQMKVGNVELDIAPAAALNDFRGALAKLEALEPAEQQQLNLRRLRALLLRKQAMALAELGRYTEMAPLFDGSWQIYSKISEADPKDTRALKDLDKLLTIEAFSYENASDFAPFGNQQYHAKAETLEAQRAANLQTLLHINPNDTTAMQELAAAQIRLDTLRAADHAPDAETIKRDTEALTLLKTAAANDKATPLLLDLAFHAFMEAKPATLRDTAFALQCADRGATLTHHRAPSWLLPLAQAYRATGDIAKAKSTATEGLALLPNDPSEQTFRLRKLLEAEAKN